MILSNRINPFLLAIGTTSALLTVLALVFYWYLIVLIVFLIIATRIGIYRGYIQPKITKINRNKVIKIPLNETDILYPIILEVKAVNKETPEAYYRLDWLFKIFYFIIGRKQWQVKAILPEMQEYDVNLQECLYTLKEVKLVERSDRNLKYQTNSYLADSIKILSKKIEPKIASLKENLETIDKELEVLALSPKIYQKQIQIYSQLEEKTAKLIQNGTATKEAGLDLIRDILIGTDLSQIEPEKIPEIPDKQKQFDRNCQLFLEKYQILKKQLDSNIK